MHEMPHFDYVIINDNFDTALTEFECIVLAQRNGYHSQVCKHTSLIKQLLAKSAN